jgi:hypothetical protein
MRSRIRRRDPLADLPAVKRLGEGFRRLERAEGGLPHQPAARLLALPGIGLAVVVLALILALSLGGRAHALSPISRAPAAALRSGTVHFSSTIAITRGGRELQRFAQTGEADFGANSYRTTLAPTGVGVALEWRIVGGVLYVAQTHGVGRIAIPNHWIAARLARGQERHFASPETDAITDPLAVFRILENSRAPVRYIGPSSVGGVPAQEYRVTTSLGTLVDASAPRSRIPERLRSVAAVLNVWLDREGRPSRVNEILAGGQASRPARLESNITYGAYGTATTIAAPPGVSPTRVLREGFPNPLVGGPTRVFERFI